MAEGRDGRIFPSRLRTTGVLNRAKGEHFEALSGLSSLSAGNKVGALGGKGYGWAGAGCSIAPVTHSVISVPCFVGRV